MQVSGQIIKFGTVGGATAFAQMAVAAMLASAFRDWPVWVTNLLALPVAFWVSLFGHRHLTFATLCNQLRFLGATLIALVVNNICLAAALVQLNDLLSNVLSAIVVPAAVLFIFRAWVFNGQS